MNGKAHSVWRRSLREMTESTLTVTFMVVALQWLSLRLQRFQQPETRLLDGVMGGPHFFGYSETVERWLVISLLLITTLSAILLLESYRFLERKMRTNAWPLPTGVFVVFAAGVWKVPLAWQQFALGAVAMVITGSFLRRIGTRVVSWTRSDLSRPLGYAALGALSFHCLVHLRLLNPWSPVPEAMNPPDFVYTLVESGFVFCLLSFWLLRTEPRVSYRQQFLIVAIGLSPTLALVRFLTFLYFVALFPEDQGTSLWSQHWPDLLGKFSVGWVALSLGILAWHRRKKSEGGTRAFAWIGAPCLLYLLASPITLRCYFEPWHEADVFLAARGLMEGKVPYRDIFIPHGVGNAFLGVLGMRLWGPTIGGFRLIYQFLSPLVWVLHYFCFYALLPKRGRVGLAFLLALAACSLSGLNLPYDIGLITWYGGIKLFGPLLVLGAGIWFSKQLYLGGRQIWFLLASGALGATAATALFLNMERGIASLAFAFTLVAVESFKQRKLGKIIGLGILSALAGFFLFSCLLWLPFVDFETLCHGILFHVLVFAKRHSQQWGLPLFDTRFDSSTLFSIFCYLPLLAAIFGMVVAWKQGRREAKDFRGALVFPLAVLSFAIYQVSVGRSDFPHLMVGLGLTGFLIFLVVYEVHGRAGLLVLVLASLCLPAPFQNWWHLTTNLVRKRQPVGAYPTGYSDALVEGAHPLLLPSQRRLISKVTGFLAQHPELGELAFFLTEKHGLYKLFTKLKDPMPWTMHHYILSDTDQRFAASQLQQKKVAMVWVSAEPTLVEKFSRTVRWPVLSHYLFNRYVPCATFEDEMLLVAREWKASCRQAPWEPKVRDSIFAQLTSLHQIPAFFGKVGIDHIPFPEIKFARVRVKQTETFPLSLSLTWPCPPWFGEGRAELSFTTNPDQKDYLLPLSSVATWAYCGASLKSAHLKGTRSGKIYPFGEIVGWEKDRELVQAVPSLSDVMAWNSPWRGD